MLSDKKSDYSNEHIEAVSNAYADQYIEEYQLKRRKRFKLNQKKARALQTMQQSGISVQVNSTTSTTSTSSSNGNTDHDDVEQSVYN